METRRWKKPPDEWQAGSVPLRRPGPEGELIELGSPEHSWPDKILEQARRHVVACYRTGFPQMGAGCDFCASRSFCVAVDPDGDLRSMADDIRWAEVIVADKEREAEALVMKGLRHEDAKSTEEEGAVS